MIDECKLNNHIKIFASTISKQELGVVSHVPEGWGRQTMCFENVRIKVQREGGRVCYGWMFLLRSVAAIPDANYIIAVHHAVWCSSSGSLIDVTPFHDDPKHRPFTPGGNVLFLVDNNAVPIPLKEGIKGAAPLSSQFYPLEENQKLIDHLHQLKQKTDHECQEIYKRYGN